MQFQIDSTKKAKSLKEITFKFTDTINLKKVPVKDSLKETERRNRQ